MVLTPENFFGKRKTIFWFCKVGDSVCVTAGVHFFCVLIKEKKILRGEFQFGLPGMSFGLSNA